MIRLFSSLWLGMRSRGVIGGGSKSSSPSQSRSTTPTTPPAPVITNHLTITTTAYSTDSYTTPSRVPPQDEANRLLTATYIPSAPTDYINSSYATVDPSAPAVLDVSTNYHDTYTASEPRDGAPVVPDSEASAPSAPSAECSLTRSDQSLPFPPQCALYLASIAKRLTEYDSPLPAPHLPASSLSPPTSPAAGMVRGTGAAKGLDQAALLAEIKNYYSKFALLFI